MTAKKCIHKIKNKNTDDPIFILLCAKKSNNRGYRNVPLTPVRDKDLLIDIQIKTIRKKYRNSEIIIISGFEHNKLIDHIKFMKYENIRIAENKNYKNSDTLDGWRFALNIALKSNTYIIHADRIFSASCIAVDRHSYVVSHNVDKSNYNLGILVSENKLVNMSYGLPSVWSEVFFISEQDFDKTRDMINSKHRKVYNIETFINELSQIINISVVEVEPTDIRPLKEI